MKLKESKIDSGVRFSLKYITIPELMSLRRQNINITHMLWIHQKPKWDEYLNEFYNPMTPILMFKN